jgi:hypothetical protein
MYLVRGGVYTDTNFETLEGDEESYGPYPTYEEAVQTWKAKMGWKIDICCHRLFIAES